VTRQEFTPLLLSNTSMPDRDDPLTAGMVDRSFRPRLRHVEAFPVDANGRQAIAIRDPAGFTNAVLLLAPPLLEVVSLFDGEHSVGDIQEILTRRTGELVMTDEICRIIGALDEQGFLDSPRFADRRAAIERAFAASPTRPATHAGGAYAGEPAALRAQMDAFFAEPHGPGTIQWATGQQATAGQSTIEARGAADGQVSAGHQRDADGRWRVDDQPAAGDRGVAAGRERPVTRVLAGTAQVGRGSVARGLVAPHIDFHRGGPAYAWGYRDLAERSDADCFIVFGTCHAGIPDPFALTLKDYDTPFGPAVVDRALATALAHRAGQDVFASELAHRTEHSIEFQAVFLRYLFAGRREFTIVPVLASFVHEAIARGQRPEDDPRVPRFFDALAELIASTGVRVAVIAGADLAHVGPRFGDPEAVTAGWLGDVEREDRAMLDAVVAGDYGAFFESAARDGDRRRVCGLSPIYALLRTLGATRGELKRYAQWPDPQGAVTFASVVMT
jgi:MEMO1 family protein